MDLLQLGRRVDAELVGEPGAEPLVDVQRVGLPAAGREGPHQLAGEPLVQRVLEREGLELGDEGVRVAELEVGVDPVEDGHEPQVVEAGGVGGERVVGRRRARRAGEGRAAPQREGLGEHVGRRAVLAAAQGRHHRP